MPSYPSKSAERPFLSLPPLGAVPSLHRVRLRTIRGTKDTRIRCARCSISTKIVFGFRLVSLAHPRTIISVSKTLISPTTVCDSCCCDFLFLFGSIILFGYCYFTTGAPRGRPESFRPSFGRPTPPTMLPSRSWN